MTRDKLLQYITNKHGKALREVGIEPTDTPESLFFILNDAQDGESDSTQKSIADREVARFIHDRVAFLAEGTTAVQEDVANVSD